MFGWMDDDSDPVNKQVSDGFVSTTIAMVLFPLITFWLCQYHLLAGWEPVPDHRLPWSGGAAILAANIVSVSFVIRAIREDAEEAEAKKEEGGSGGAGDAVQKPADKKAQ